MENQEVGEEFKKNPGRFSLYLYIMLVISALILGGCKATTTKIQELQQKFVRSMRKPGEKMVASPENTSKKYSCSPYKQTILVLEKAETIPSKVFPGEEINQRIRYALCPYTPSGTVRGEIIRTVLFKGETAFQDVTNYEFKPGTWTVDVFIEIPYDAQSGIYALEVVLTYSQKTTRESNTFIVKSE